jgi:hypothetical protein
MDKNANQINEVPWFVAHLGSWHTLVRGTRNNRFPGSWHTKQFFSQVPWFVAHETIPALVVAHETIFCIVNWHCKYSMQIQRKSYAEIDRTYPHLGSWHTKQFFSQVPWSWHTKQFLPWSWHTKQFFVL